MAVEELICLLMKNFEDENLMRALRIGNFAKIDDNGSSMFVVGAGR